MIESRLESALFWFHVKPAHSHRKTLTMPHTPVRRCTLSATLFRLNSMPSIPSGATYSTVDRQHPHSSGIRLVLTCYSTCHVCLRGRRIQRGSSSGLESRFQCSVPSAESLGTFPSDAPLLVSRETCSRGLCWHHGSTDLTLQPLLPGMVSPVHLLSVPGMPDTTVRIL